MIEEYLVEVREVLLKALNEQQLREKSSLEAQAGLEASLEAAKEAFEQKKHEITNLNKMRLSEESGVKQTANGVEKAKAAEAAKGEEKEGLQFDLNKAHAFLETFRAFRESPPAKKKEVEKVVKRITPVLESMKPDASLRKSWAATATKGSKEERNDFDEMTLGAVEQLFKKDVDTKEERMTRHAEEVAALEVKTQDARQAA